MQEKSDFIEIEVKLVDGDPAVAVQLMSECPPPKGSVVQKAPTAFFDLYLDTPSLALHRMGSSFRFRFGEKAFRKRGKLRANFKAPRTAEATPWLSRREVRTDLTRDEVLPLPSTSLPGTACELAYDIARQAGAAEEALGPVVLISTFRRYFTMKAADPETPDLMLFSTERSEMMDARALDVAALLTDGSVAWSPPPPLATLAMSELELTVEDAEAESLFHSLVAQLLSRFSTTTENKYEHALAALGIVGGEGR